MSAYAGYYCHTCNKFSITDLNWGFDILKEIYKNRYLLFHIHYELINAYSISVNKHSDYINFLYEHVGHRIYLADEYGRAYSMSADFSNIDNGDGMDKINILPKE